MIDAAVSTDVALVLGVATLAIKALVDVVQQKKSVNCSTNTDALLKAFIHEYRADREHLRLVIDKIEDRMTIAVKDIASLQVIVRFLERNEDRGKSE